jgi:hypothetical protein
VRNCSRITLTTRIKSSSKQYRHADIFELNRASQHACLAVPVVILEVISTEEGLGGSFLL